MHSSRSLQSALTLRFIAAATLPLLMFGWFATLYFSERQLDEARSALQGHALSIRDEVGEFFNEVQSNLLLIRGLVGRVQTKAPAEIDSLLQTVASHSEYFEAIYLLDDRLHIRTLGLPVAMAAQRRDYLNLDLSGLKQLLVRQHSRPSTAGSRSADITWSDTFVSVITGRPSIMLLMDLPGGYLLGTVNLEKLANFLQRRVRQSEEMVFAVIDHHGTLIAHTNQQLALERVNLLSHPEVQAALDSGQESVPILREDENLLESAYLVPKSGWVVHASVPRQIVLQSAERLRIILISVMVGAILLGAVLAFWQSRRVVHPLLKLRDSTQGVARGDYRGMEHLGRTNYTELDDLFTNFIDMWAAVIERETFLRASEARYRSVMGGMGEGLLIIDRDGKVTDCNEAIERIFFLPRREILGSGTLTEHWRTLREDGTPFPLENFPSNITLKSGVDVNNRVMGLSWPDGREVWLQVNSRPLWSLQGEVSSAVVTFADVTNLKMAEASLRFGKLRYQELFQQFSALLEGITDRIDLLTPDFQVVWSNHLSTRPPADGTGSPQDSCCFASRFGRAEPCPECPVVRCFAAGRREVGEVVDRHGRTWSLRAFPVKVEAIITQVVLIAEDITEKIQGERQRIRAGQLAALGELAAGVAHEINNPISGVINYAQLIFNRAAEDSRERDLAQRIIKEGDRIAVIVRELLTFAREESAEMQIVSIREALAEALALCESQLSKEGVDLHVDLPADLPRVESRNHQIQQLFLNLISNARHALAEKYPQTHADKILRISGQLVEQAGRPIVRLKVRDHGIGIPAELIERVMNPFVTTKPAGIGTGLGLSISFEIAKKHGGTLSIASEHGAWTEVTIDLPARTSSGEQEQLAS